MTEELRDKIDELAAAMKKPSAGKIAQQLNLKHGTVYWFMLTRGILQKKPASYRQRAYTRNGVTINPYSPDHDRFMLALRVEGKSMSAIAEALVEKFGIPRTSHSVSNRIIMLSAADDEQDVAA
ncbi:hypothetical protein ONR75_24170 [Rhodopseudomonas sp. P2A-2r]|uniref:hypothetical protein n=1 Tax=Rhodopseudomonas sp. P2A-2r TaxID=2991972 RepID=UPI0022344C82|nr:hypothetical protein [Rhodopseudomonas sp. P2A-2r]UZE47936.1 hypothetical protein ONR75_24170 [Rhodopseudomonas sp. P2A-2r]